MPYVNIQITKGATRSQKAPQADALLVVTSPYAHTAVDQTGFMHVQCLYSCKLIHLIPPCRKESALYSS